MTDKRIWGNLGTCNEMVANYAVLSCKTEKFKLLQIIRQALMMYKQTWGNLRTCIKMIKKYLIAQVGFFGTLKKRSISWQFITKSLFWQLREITWYFSLKLHHFAINGISNGIYQYWCTCISRWVEAEMLSVHATHSRSTRYWSWYNFWCFIPNKIDIPLTYHDLSGWCRIELWDIRSYQWWSPSYGRLLGKTPLEAHFTKIVKDQELDTFEILQFLIIIKVSAKL